MERQVGGDEYFGGRWDCSRGVPQVPDQTASPGDEKRHGFLSGMQVLVPGEHMIQWKPVEPDSAPRELSSLLATLPLSDVLALSRVLLARPLILMTDQAREGVRSYVCRRDDESGGLLLGFAATLAGPSASLFHPLVVISESVPSQKYESTSVSLQMDASVWTAALPQRDSGLLVVGWFHSHPNLGAFFSGTDRATQRNFFYHEYSVGYVIDPIRDDHAFFIGRESNELEASQVITVASTEIGLAELAPSALSGISS
jgi:proteasome lid subunit RPN8/RPN11